MKEILSLTLTAVLLLAGCATGAVVDPARGEKEAVKMSYTLSEPVYPEFPQQPCLPEEGGEEAWDAYHQAYEQYAVSLSAIRGENPGLTEAERDMLNAFAAQSTPLVLEGREGENAVYSPLSLWSALAMLAQCANGSSRQQVLDAMGAESLDALQNQVSHIWQTLYTDDGQSALILANSIWLNSSLEGNYVQSTLDTLAQKYHAGAYAVPMGTEEADEAFTGWVSQQTRGLIGGGQPVVKTQAETLALLASSLYYKAAWEDEFSVHLTQEDVFTNASGAESKVDFMHSSKNGNFLIRDGYQAAQLATRNGMITFVLPDKGITPESLLQNPEFLGGLDVHSSDSRYGEVQWSLPKFDVNSNLGMMDAMKAMGITDLPDEGMADLSALTDLGAYMSDAKQMARVKADEEGVEAAAVTTMDIATTSMPLPPQETCVMDLDRPFLFVIRMEDVPLFVGVVNQI